jgi:hypothetical protein
MSRSADGSIKTVPASRRFAAKRLAGRERQRRSPKSRNRRVLPRSPELLSIVKIPAQFQIYRGICKNDDRFHEPGFRRARNSEMERNSPLPASTFARRAASTSPCQAGEVTASSSREIESHSCSMACKRPPRSCARHRMLRSCPKPKQSEGLGQRQFRRSVFLSDQWGRSCKVVGDRRSAWLHSHHDHQ